MGSSTQDIPSRVFNAKIDLKVENEDDGPTLFKAFIQKCHVDTNETSSFICESLSSLDDCMAKTNSNITTFNEHVQMLVFQLEARGEI